MRCMHKELLANNAIDVVFFLYLGGDSKQSMYVYS